MKSDLYEIWNWSFWGPNWLIPLILAIPSVLSAPSGTLRSFFIPINQPNQLRFQWNLKLKLLGSHLVDLTYHGHLQCSISTFWSPLKPSWILYIHITQPNQHGSSWNLKLKLLGSHLVDPTYPGHLLCSVSVLSAPSGTLWIPLYPYNSAKSTQIFMKLET